MATTKSFTRKQYLDNECTHSEYYSQFVDENIKSIVSKRFTKDQLNKSFEDGESFNSIALRVWDGVANEIQMFSSSVKLKMKEAGDSYTLAGGVCTAKAAARLIIGK